MGAYEPATQSRRVNVELPPAAPVSVSLAAKAAVAEVTVAAPTGRGPATGSPAAGGRPPATPTPAKAAEPPAEKLAEEPAEPPAEQPEASAGKPDNLTLIKGTDPRLIALLKREGITTYRQLASLTDDQIDSLEVALDAPGRIRKWNWVAQAQELLE